MPSPLSTQAHKAISIIVLSADITLSRFIRGIHLRFHLYPIITKICGCKEKVNFCLYVRTWIRTSRSLLRLWKRLLEFYGWSFPILGKSAWNKLAVCSFSWFVCTLMKLAEKLSLIHIDRRGMAAAATLAVVKWRRGVCKSSNVIPHYFVQ